MIWRTCIINSFWRYPSSIFSPVCSTISISSSKLLLGAIVFRRACFLLSLFQRLCAREKNSALGFFSQSSVRSVSNAFRKVCWYKSSASALSAQSFSQNLYISVPKSSIHFSISLAFTVSPPLPVHLIFAVTLYAVHFFRKNIKKCREQKWDILAPGSHIQTLSKTDVKGLSEMRRRIYLK